jgi:hypothetical protein
MRIAYADPPYPGQAQKHYKRDPSGIQAAEVNHAWLIRALCEWFPDGWALSTDQPSLKPLLDMCPPDVRVGIWIKSWAPMKVGVNPGYFYEPVIFHGGRKKRNRSEPTVRDYVIAPVPIKTGTHGAKPDPFSFWLFDFLGMTSADEFYDLYPGSGAVEHAWKVWEKQHPPVSHTMRRRLHQLRIAL